VPLTRFAATPFYEKSQLLGMAIETMLTSESNPAESNALVSSTLSGNSTAD
jgi:hypothetical protein